MIGPSPGYCIFLAGVFSQKRNATQKICVCYQVCFFVAFSTGSSTERGHFFQPWVLTGRLFPVRGSAFHYAEWQQQRCYLH